MPDPHRFRQAAQAASRVTRSTAIILICAFVGSWADTTFDTEPWLFFAGLAAGAVAGFTSLLRGLNLFTDDDPPADSPQ